MCSAQGLVWVSEELWRSADGIPLVFVFEGLQYWRIMVSRAEALEHLYQT